MAEVVENFEFKRIGHRGRCLYPWKEWFDGRTWKLSRTIDFNIPAKHFRNCVTNKASTLNIKVRTSVRGDDVFIQQYELQQPDAS